MSSARRRPVAAGSPASWTVARTAAPCGEPATPLEGPGYTGGRPTDGAVDAVDAVDADDAAEWSDRPTAAERAQLEEWLTAQEMARLADGASTCGVRTALEEGRHGLLLAAVLTAVGLPSGAPEADLVDQVEAWGGVVAWAQAQQAAAAGQLLARREDAPAHASRPLEKDAWRDTVAQVALALRASTQRAEQVVADSQALAAWPAAAAALRRGRIDLPTLRAVAEEGSLVGAEHRPALETAALEQAGEGRTARQVLLFLRRTAMRLDPSAAQRRAEAARRDRGLARTGVVDGMGDLRATLTADELKAVWESVTTRAAALPGTDAEGEALSLDERRADVLVDLLLHPERVRDCDHPDRDRWRADVVVAATTLTGDDDAPADLVGYGLVDAGTARALLDGATLRRLDVDDAGHVTGRGARRHPVPSGPDGLRAGVTALLVEPVTPLPEHRAGDGYRPGPAVRDHVESLHRRCRFPGCGRPSTSCDLDHCRAFSSGGVTCVCNLVPLCRTHHLVKHTDGWSLRTHADRSVTWSTPTGRRYRDPPPCLPP